MSGGSRLLTDELLRRLDRMTIAAKSRVRGTMQGKRRSRLLGNSLEFADFRPYAPGDDIRRIDWNVYGRTGKAFVRQFWDEQEMNVRLYVDASRSMRVGDGGLKESQNSDKYSCALKLAACVGYIALSGEDRVSACTFADRIASSLPTIRGKGSTARLFGYLEEQLSASELIGTDDLSESFVVPGSLPRVRGQCWLFTDGLYESGIERTLNAFAAAGQHLVFVQTLGPEELNPAFTGELKLIDSESGIGKEVAIGSGVMSAYRNALRDHIGNIRRLCLERGFAYVLADTSVPVEDTAIRTLLAEGLLLS